jgi:hypothetical protein
MGAPNLTDAITLYGMDMASLTETITNSRNGVMPALAAVITRHMSMAMMDAMKKANT